MLSVIELNCFLYNLKKNMGKRDLAAYKLIFILLNFREDFFAPTPAQTPMEGDVAPSFPASNSSDLHKYTTFRHDDNVDDEEEAKMMFIRPSARRLLRPRGGNATL